MPFRRISRSTDVPPAAPQSALIGSATPAPRRRQQSRDGDLGAGLAPDPDVAREATPNTEDAYKVGYRKPPINTRFMKGRSGNPKGRPGGARNEKTLINDILGARIAVRTPEGKRRLNSFEISLMKLREKAAQGDLRAIREVLTYLGRISAEADHAAQNDVALTAADEMILQYLLGSDSEAALAHDEKGSSDEH